MNSVTITSFRDKVPFSEHVVVVAPGQRSLEIREIRNLLHQPGALATCIFEIHPRDYRRVEMSIRRGSQRSELKIEVDEIERYIHIHGNSSRTIDCSEVERILLDGPSPMFDWVNAVMMLGICDGEAFDIPVHAIDVQSGTIVRSDYTYRRTDHLITVAKGLDALADSELLLRSDYSIDVCYSQGFRYEFDGGGDTLDEV